MIRVTSNQPLAFEVNFNTFTPNSDKKRTFSLQIWYNFAQNGDENQMIK